MRRFRSYLIVAALAGAGIGVVGTTPSATAYCEAEPTFAGPDGSASASGCSNSCTKLAPTMDKLTKPGFWMCPQ